MNLETDAGQQLARSRARFIAFGMVAAIVFAVLAGRLFQLQVLGASPYGAADGQLGAEVAVPAPRGLIFDREGRALVANVPAWTIKARPADLPIERRRTILEFVADLTGASAADLETRVNSYRGSPYDLVPLLRGVEREVALLVAEARPDLPGIEVAVEPVRRYLDGSGGEDGMLLAHILGYTAPIDAESLERLGPSGYLPDDVVGQTGIEASYEAELRGQYGRQVVERDATGRPVKVVETRSQPRAGTNLVLSIDTEIQRMATNALEWGMEVAGVSQGVTIVMNPQTGEILGMVSLPSYDNNAFAAGIDADQFNAYLGDPNQPLRNHAIQDIYPPGSTYKIVTALAALEEGVTTPERPWQTYGCYQIPDAPAGECLYDWNRAGFGRIGLVDAFAVSSDTYFYQMAIQTGIDPLAEWGRDLGFGEPTGVALPGEANGTVPSTQWAQQQGRSGVFTGEVAQAGIGQNVVAVTPLQLLNAYAALANGGRLMRPMIVVGEADDSGALTRPYEPEVVRQLKISDEHLGVIRVASREVITTGHAYNISELPLPGALSGKTGTAEFGEPHADGSLPFHSWFVAYLPSSPGATDAELAVVTFTYAATVPGNVSTEVVKHFLQQYFDVERDYRLDPRTFALLEAN